MIGIVVVSHSPALAEATVALALEMVPGERPEIRVAAGAGDGVTGTDAAKVADAIRDAASGDGVLVLMDLGSAVLSAELAVEFVADLTEPVRLSAAPFVEGLVAAVVRAAGGASLDEVAAEARGALAAKASQLDDDAPPPAPTVATAGGETASFTLRNPSGLHARPVAMIVTALAPLEARVSITNVTAHRGPVPANSTIALLTLGAATGDVIEVAAAGPAARDAIATVSRLVDEGFGEL